MIVLNGDEVVAWATTVVARGWPRKSAPVAQRIEWYEDLVVAYQMLAAQARLDGDTDSYLARSDLANHAARLAQQLR